MSVCELYDGQQIINRIASISRKAYIEKDLAVLPLPPQGLAPCG